MKIYCYKICDDLKLQSVEYDNAINELKSAESKIWIDVQGIENENLEKKLDEIEITGMSKRLCLEANNRQGFYPMNNLTFFVIPVLASSGDFHEIEHVAFLIRQNLLLTIRDMRATQLQKTISFKDSKEWLLGKSVQGLVTAFLIVISLEALQRTEELRNVIIILEKQMDSQPDSVTMEEISHKRSELLTFESVVSGQLPALEVFAKADSEQIKGGKIPEYLLCALSNLKATKNSLDWLEGRIDVLRTIYDTRAQEKTNRRLGRLTIVSAIFLPMTFLAGLWGMNFQYMPGLKHPLSYPIAVGFMLLIALGIYLYFRKNKWLD